MRLIEKTKEKYRQEGRQEVIKESQEWVEVNENEIDISKGSPPPWETTRDATDKETNQSRVTHTN